MNDVLSMSVLQKLYNALDVYILQAITVMQCVMMKGGVPIFLEGREEMGVDICTGKQKQQIISIHR